MLDLFGFEIPTGTTNINNQLSLLDEYCQQGFIMLKTSQAMKILNLTYGQIRYAILNYELDAYLICNRFRITPAAIKSFLSKEQELFERQYHEEMLKHELSGVYNLAFKGNIPEALASLKRHSYPISSLDDLCAKNKQYKYDSMEAGTTEPYDFYDIESLGLPPQIDLYVLAAILQVQTADIAAELNVSSNAILSYPEVYDYLMVKQLLNINIPISDSSSQKIIKESGQLFFL